MDIPGQVVELFAMNYRHRWSDPLEQCRQKPIEHDLLPTYHSKPRTKCGRKKQQLSNEVTKKVSLLHGENKKS